VSTSIAAKQAEPARKVAAKKVVAKLPSTPVAKAPAAKKATATNKIASDVAVPATASVASGAGAAPGLNSGSVTDLKKAVSHVVASLSKTTGKPTMHAKLVAAIKSLLGPSADEPAAHSVLSQLLASGKVVIDSKGSVRYALQPA
jgi:hypothetical protein